MSDYPDLIHGAKPGQLIHRPTLVPVATYVFLALNFLAFAVMVAIDASSLPPLGAIISRTLTGMSTDPELLLRLGASFGPYTHRGEYWRLVMPMFLHIGLLHLAINNYSLYILGRLLEPIYGYGRFAFLYVVSGIGSAYLSMSMSNNVSAGASGAIFGIAGVMLVAGYLHKGSIPRQWGRAFGKGMLPIIVLNLAFGGALHQWVDNWAHLGGLVSGVILALLIPPPNREYVPGQPMEENSQAMAAIPVIIVAAAIVATALHYRTNTVLTRVLREGQVFHALKRNDWALQRFKAAAASAPRDERPHEAMGQIYSEQEKWPDAAREYEQALKLNPTSVEAGIGAAQAQMEMGNSAKAQEYLKSVQEDIPETAEAHYELADLYSQHKFYTQAIGDYQTALRLDPKMKEAELGLAGVYQATGNTAQAHESLQMLEKDYPDTPAGQSELGSIYSQFKFDADAARHYERALHLKPDLPAIQNNLAWLYATTDDSNMRNPEAALEHARRAVELTRWTQPTFIDTLAEALYANQEYAEAVNVQTKALKLAPRNQVFAEHMARYLKASKSGTEKKSGT
jgi:membrane associated rhomboid family serine protease/tetratricopeptide (TPR) repeat protein